MSKHLAQRPCPFLLTRSGKFVHTRRRGIASSPHGRLRRKKSSMLPDQISVEGSRQRHGLYHRPVRPISMSVQRTRRMISKGDLLVLDFSQYQPAVIPAPGTGRVSNDLPLSLIQTL